MHYLYLKCCENITAYKGLRKWDNSSPAFNQLKVFFFHQSNYFLLRNLKDDPMVSVVHIISAHERIISLNFLKICNVYAFVWCKPISFLFYSNL